VRPRSEETTSISHPANHIDDVVHQRHRPGVMVLLAEAKRADLTYLEKVLELTDGNLGRHSACPHERRPASIHAID